jgi:tetratricopeptide (TPR) repeat protein
MNARRLDLPAVAAALALVLGACAGAGTGPSTAAASQPVREAGAASGAPAPAAATSPAAPGAPQAGALSPRAQRLFDEAVATLEEQRKLKVPVDWQVLERRWRAVIEAQEIPEAWFNLGVALERQGKGAEARAAYERALVLRPGFQEAAVNLALLGEPAGDPRRAAADYAALLKKYPGDAPARVRLAALYREAGQLDEAWRLAREALRRDPGSVGAYKVMMRVALERGNPDLAELIAVRAQKLSPDDPELTVFTGDVLARRGEEALARAQYRKALEQRPDFAAARYQLLRLALQNQSWEGVVEQGKAILQRDPGESRVWLALGVAHRYLNQPDQALAAFEKAESLSAGKLPEIHLARALTHMKVRNACEPAVAELQRYQTAVGPAAASGGPAPRLQRECEQMLVAARQAEEAAKQMQRDAERKAAEEAARKAAPAAAAPAATPAASAPAAAKPVGEGK